MQPSSGGDENPVKAGAAVPMKNPCLLSEFIERLRTPASAPAD